MQRALMSYGKGKGQDHHAHLCSLIWHSLLVNIYCKQTMEAQINMHECAGWSGLALSTNCIWALFMCHTSYVFMEKSVNYFKETFIAAGGIPEFLAQFQYLEFSVILRLALWIKSSAENILNFFFPQKQEMTFHANCLKCQILFSGKNCHLL